MSSQGGRGGGQKLPILLSKKTTKRGGGGQKLPILRRHSLWMAPNPIPIRGGRLCPPHHYSPRPTPLDIQIFLRSWVVFCQLFRCLELWWITFSVCVVYYCSTIKICWLLPDVFEFRLLISPTPFSHAFELGSSSYTYKINSLLEFQGTPIEM